MSKRIKVYCLLLLTSLDLSANLVKQAQKKKKRRRNDAISMVSSWCAWEYRNGIFALNRTNKHTHMRDGERVILYNVT